MAIQNLSQIETTCQVYPQDTLHNPIYSGSSYDFDKHGSYLDPVAKSNISLASKQSPKFNDVIYEMLNPHCGRWAAVGVCALNHSFAKKLNCGREWCTVCRDDSHNRRIARWYPKLRQLDSVGYLVITFPLPIRVLLRHKAALSLIGRRTTKVLKRHGFNKGLRRWHFFGDDSTVYNPHLNVLVEGRYMRGEALEALKADISRTLIPAGIREYYGEDLVINYQYHKTPARIYHKLKYVTRATFLNYTWDDTLAMVLHGFRNCNTWGKWNGDIKWTINSEATLCLNELHDLDKNICPVCQAALSWSKPTLYSWIESDNNISYGGGFYRLPDHIPKIKKLSGYNPIRYFYKRLLRSLEYAEDYLPVDVLTGEIKVNYNYDNKNIKGIDNA